MRHLTLATKITFLVSLVSTLIVTVTAVIFSLSYYSISKSDVRQFLVEETEELITNQITYTDGLIRYLPGPQGETISTHLKNHNLSGIILDNTLTPIGIYGTYAPIYNLQIPILHPNPTQLPTSLPLTPSFGYFRLEGHPYESYTSPLIFEGETVGLVQIAKETELVDRLLQLNLNILVFLIPLSIVINWLVSTIIIRKSLTPLAQLISYLQNPTTTQSLERVIVDDSSPEIAALVSSFNNMIERVGKSLEKQRDFISHASHELKTPLTQAISTLDLALLEKKPSSLHTQISLTKSNLLHLNQILDSLLTLSKLEHQSLTKLPKPTNLLRSLTHALSLLENETTAKHLQLHLTCPPDISVPLSSEHLHILVTNILTNSIKFSPPHTTITLTAHPVTPTRLELRDEGPGITPEDRHRLFDKFFRSKHTAHRTSGSGLGMAIVKRICDTYRIQISVTPALPRGTSIILTFP